MRIVQGTGATQRSADLLTGLRWALSLGFVALAPLGAPASPPASPTGSVAGCPSVPDTDGDGVGDACDNCPNTLEQARNPSDYVEASIPDHGSGCGTITTGLSRTITLDENGVVSNLKLVLDIEHFAYSDLNITLTHNGTVVTVAPFATTTTNNRIGVRLGGVYVFDDAANTYFDQAAFSCFIDQDCTVLFPGTYRGSQDLAAFEGMDVRGDWTLTINDSCSQSFGFLWEWSMDLSVAYPDQSDYDYDGVGDVCDVCPNSSFSTEGLDEDSVPIPDGNGACSTFTTELTRTIRIAERGRVDFLEMAVELDHTWYDDLDIRLEHNGTIVTLASSDPDPYISSDLGGTYTFADYAAETLDQAALNCYNSNCPVIPDGTYLGQESLSAFYGIDAQGDWTLSIRDTCYQYEGTLYLWTLSIFVQDPDQTDTDLDGAGDICDLCAAGAGSGDTEADGDLDLYDYAKLAACPQGIGVSLSPGCECFDFDGDGDIDLLDFRNLALEFQPEPGCRIDGVFYQPGESDAPPFACQTCRPKINRKEWTLAAAGSVCRPAAGSCDIAEFCTGASGICPPDAIQPSGYQCRPNAGDCDIAESCTGSSSACPPDETQPSSYECRPSVGSCDVAEFCTGASGICPPDAFQPLSYICLSNTGPNGEYLCRDNVTCSGTTPACTYQIIGYDANRVCRQSTAACDPAEYCAGPETCSPDVRWSAGQECPGASACELPYTCDAGGNCNYNGLRSGTASCRTPSNDCDQRDYCGSCDAGGNCSSPFPVGDVRNRTDFEDYPECGPDMKKPDGVSCAFGAFAGTCFSGECITISNCRYNIDCPDGYVCNSGDCVAASVDHGFGDECVGKKFCDYNSPALKIGTICTFPVDCQDAAHPNGNCTPGIRGDCVGRQNGRDLVCCAGMAGDGFGGAAGPGQKGRCQECCATDYNDVTVTGCGDFTCCDGKCTDPLSDPHHCGGCAYNGGVDCDKLLTACTPTVLGCVEGARGGECDMQSACYDANDPFSIYDLCIMDGSYQVPDPSCNYCAPSLTPNPALHNIGCLSDNDCGGTAGSCHIVDARCSPDSMRPYAECDPSSLLGDAQCWAGGINNGRCVASCSQCSEEIGTVCVGFWQHTYSGTVFTNACETPPYGGCQIDCTRDEALCADPVNPDEILGANYGATCKSDSDCYCGLTCQSSCGVSAGRDPFDFCWSPDTCQLP